MNAKGSMPARIFVTGTDTGVGKTVLSLLVMRYLLDVGEKPFYIKLIQTGCAGPLDVNSDARFIFDNLPQTGAVNLSQSVPLCFKKPKAPWFAARDEGRRIDLEVLVDSARRAEKEHSVLVMEGAGGLFVPVDSASLMIDLLRMLDARPVLAARAGLGAINHTLLSLEALERRGLVPLGVVLIDSGPLQTPPDMVSENIEAIEKFSGIKPAGVIGPIVDFSNLPPESLQPIRAMLAHGVE